MSSAHAIDTRDHVAAVEAALPAVDLYDYGTVPGVKNPSGETNPGAQPSNYALVQVERMDYPTTTAARVARRTLWRLQLRAVGTSPNNCREIRKRLLSLESARLTIAGRTTTPLHAGPVEDARPDDSRWSALVEFTYGI